MGWRDKLAIAVFSLLLMLLLGGLLCLVALALAYRFSVGKL